VSRSPRPLLGSTPSFLNVRRAWRTRRRRTRSRMAEHDGVGDLHHGGLQVQREQHAVLLRIARSAKRRRRAAPCALITEQSMISPALTGTLPSAP
jgi:hypothetical protein